MLSASIDAPKLTSKRGREIDPRELRMVEVRGAEQQQQLPTNATATAATDRYALSVALSARDQQDEQRRDQRAEENDPGKRMVIKRQRARESSRIAAC